MQAKRRWFQFSLRTLVVVMLLVSLVLGYWGYARRRAQRQWEAVRAIEEAGGYVSVDNEFPEDPFGDESLTSELPNWRKRLGIECPAVISVDVPPYTGPSANDSSKDAVSSSELKPLVGRGFGPKTEVGRTISDLRQLPQLEGLKLSGDWLDDECLQAISGFRNLTDLSIQSDQITDAGILSIAGNKKLESLHVSGQQLTDRGMAVVAQLPELLILDWQSENTAGEGLVHLRNHPHLAELKINGATASDAGFEHLSTCPNLVELVIDGPNTLTSRGVGVLARLRLKRLIFIKSPLSKDAASALTNLTTLNSLRSTWPSSAEDLSLLLPLVSLKSLTLEDCKLTGEGLKHLAPLKQLNYLKVDMASLGDEDMELLSSFVELAAVNLKNSAVTDAGLMKLAGLKNLSWIDIEGTKVTAEGVKEFKRLAPNVKVFERLEGTER